MPYLIAEGEPSSLNARLLDSGQQKRAITTFFRRFKKNYKLPEKISLIKLYIVARSCIYLFLSRSQELILPRTVHRLIFP